MGIEEQQSQHGHLKGDGDEHQAEIGGRGVRQRSLDVDLSDGDERPADGADRADHLQHHQGDRRVLEQRHDLEQHDGTTGDDHGIAQDRCGIGSLHGLVEPEVHGELSTLTGGPGHQTETEKCCRQWGQCVLSRPAVEILKARDS